VPLFCDTYKSKFYYKIIRYQILPVQQTKYSIQFIIYLFYRVLYNQYEVEGCILGQLGEHNQNPLMSEWIFSFKAFLNPCKQ